MTTLPEALLLLALDDETGRVPVNASMALRYGLAGGVLLELLLAGRLEVHDGTLAVVDASPVGDPALDGALATIAGDRHRRGVRGWVNRLGTGQLKEAVLDQLVQKGVLRKEEHRIMWVVPADRYPAQSVATEHEMRARLRAVVLDGVDPDPRTAVLVGLVKACHLSEVVFSRDERQAARGRIDAIASGEQIGEAVSGAVADVQAAMMAAVTAAVIAASTAASSTSSNH